MPPPPSACDVLIVGGGPAAATAARLLSRWGWRVHVAARPAAGEPELPESLTPSCQKFFDLLGISAAVDAGGFVRSSGHTVWWGSDQPRVEPFAGDARGWQVTSGRLSAVMLAAAAEAGATVRAEVLDSDAVLGWPARYRIDATGRSGVLAKTAGQRVYEPGHRTVALVGTWHHDRPWALDDPSHTLLESYADGWAWSVPLPSGERAVAVMVDPRTTALARGDGATAVYRGEIAKTTRLATLVRRATLTGRPVGWDASMYRAARPTGDGWLLAGDALSFIDPLSSAGVRKAMASGWLSAVAVNTALRHPERAEAAFAFYSERETHTYQQFLALTRQHLADGAQSGEPFWADRSGTPSGADAAAHRAAVEAAFARLSAASRLDLRLGPGVIVAPRPALTEREIVLEPQLVGASGEGVRYVLGVDLVVLAEVAAGASDVPGLYARYTERAGESSWPEFLTALATSISQGWLVGI